MDFSTARDEGILDYCRLQDHLEAWSPLQFGFFKGTFVDNAVFRSRTPSWQRLLNWRRGQKRLLRWSDPSPSRENADNHRN
jgi:predicted oxidoreductase